MVLLLTFITLFKIKQMQIQGQIVDIENKRIILAP